MTGPSGEEAARTADEAPPPPGRASPGFAHASEAEFARILDFYQVGWLYEPHLYPILWSLDGEVLESFAPDFYLPELDLYVEMTTLRQKLVRKKNRKLRRLRELYPDVRIKLFYARDFRALMLKYGKVALADALSGAEGQFTPEHPGPAAEAADRSALAGVAVASRSEGRSGGGEPAGPVAASVVRRPTRGRPRSEPLPTRAAAPTRSAAPTRAAVAKGAAAPTRGPASIPGAPAGRARGSRGEGKAR